MPKLANELYQVLITFLLNIFSRQNYPAYFGLAVVVNSSNQTIAGVQMSTKQQIEILFLPELTAFFQHQINLKMFCLFCQNLFQPFKITMKLMCLEASSIKLYIEVTYPQALQAACPSLEQATTMPANAEQDKHCLSVTTALAYHSRHKLQV